MKEMTIDEFNKEWGINAYHHPVYKIASEDDIDTFVQCRGGSIIPYFCEWNQSDTYDEALSKSTIDNSNPIIKILPNKGEVNAKR